MSRDEKNFERKPICFQQTVGRNLMFKYASVRVQKKLRNMLLETEGGRLLLQSDKKKNLAKLYPGVMFKKILKSWFYT